MSVPRARLQIALIPVALALIAAGCTAAPASQPTHRLAPCPSERALQDAYCGKFQVFENRGAGSGRRIDLQIVVLPASTDDERRDPLFFLAGGPGQGAAEMAATVATVFADVRRTRDIVLVDQRGTGKSHPLNCRPDSDSLDDVFPSDAAIASRVRACLQGLDADVRFYTTSIAMDDLEDVRAYLGYGAVNLYGGSYGTRAALVYLRQHGDRVRSVVLDGVVPTAMQLPLFTARDAERALAKLLADCDADEGCRSAYPGLPERIRTLLQRLGRKPVRVRLVHPRTGVPEVVDVTARAVASMIFGALYAPSTAALLPILLDRADRDDFQGLVALAVAGSAQENMSVGMQLSILCSEDAPRIRAGDLDRETAGTVFGGYLAVDQMNACEHWPRGTVDASYYEPVTSDVPALVLSGDLDPVTPASWGESVVTHLSNAHHLVAPGTGHGVAGTACGQKLVAAFLEHGDADGLDTRCLETLKRPPFFLSLAGPDPAAAKR